MAGFAASGLSGEMDQTARNRTLSAFKQSGLRVLIATDVAARGIDAQNVTRVVHAELPTNPDAYTHRAGRTGRAGRKGISSLLVAPSGVVHATRLLRGLRVQHRVEPIPSAEQIERAADERLLAELTADQAGQIAPETGDAAADGGEQEPALSSLENESELARWIPLATRLIQAGSLERTLSRLLAHSRANVTRPREIRVFAERPARNDTTRGRTYDRNADDRRAPRRDRDAQPGRDYDRAAQSPRAPHRNRDDQSRQYDRTTEARTAPGDAQGRESERSAESGRVRGQAPRRARDAHDRAGTDAAAPAANGGGPFNRFQVTWGRQQGADPRRMLAMVCRRGEIRGRDVGAIEIEDRHSIVEVAESVADGFERAARRPDPREPKVLIRREQSAHASGPRRSKTDFKPRRDKRKSAAQRPLKRKTPK
jgi:ATP-dependent RNA helicase DeaD